MLRQLERVAILAKSETLSLLELTGESLTDGRASDRHRIERDDLLDVERDVHGVVGAHVENARLRRESDALHVDLLRARGDLGDEELSVDAGASLARGADENARVRHAFARRDDGAADDAPRRAVRQREILTAHGRG